MENSNLVNATCSERNSASGGWSALNLKIHLLTNVRYRKTLYEDIAVRYAKKETVNPCLGGQKCNSILREAPKRTLYWMIHEKQIEKCILKILVKPHKMMTKFTVFLQGVPQFGVGLPGYTSTKLHMLCTLFFKWNGYRYRNNSPVFLSVPATEPIMVPSTYSRTSPTSRDKSKIAKANNRTHECQNTRPKTAILQHRCRFENRWNVACCAPRTGIEKPTCNLPRSLFAARKHSFTDADNQLIKSGIGHLITVLERKYSLASEARY